MVQISSIFAIVLAVSALLAEAAPVNAPKIPVADACLKARAAFKISVKDTFKTMKALRTQPAAQDAAVQDAIKKAARSLFAARKASGRALRALSQGKSSAKSIAKTGKKMSDAQSQLSTLKNLKAEAQTAVQGVQTKLTQAAQAEKAFEAACGGSAVTSGQTGTVGQKTTGSQATSQSAAAATKDSAKAASGAIQVINGAKIGTPVAVPALAGDASKKGRRELN